MIDYAKINFNTIGWGHISERLKKIPLKVPQREPVIPFLQKRRYIPQEVSKEHFSYFTISKVPHLKEILECLEPEHPSTHISIMKSVQAGITTSIAENAMIYYIMNRIGSVLYLMSNRNMLKIRASLIDAMIDNTEGMADLIVPISKRNIHSARTADRAEYKEFMGGIQLALGSYGSTTSMKSIPYVLIIRDEWSEAPAEVKREGSIEGLIESRTIAASRFKILSLSTPSHSGTCLIEKSFLQGDQREWFVPCPYCGHMQILVMKKEDQKHGLTFEIEKSKLGEITLIPESVGYICIACEKMFYDEHKRRFMPYGEWRPCHDEYPPKSSYQYSYHISGLMNPFLKWQRICQLFIDTNMGHDLSSYHSFSINILGEAYQKAREKPNWKVFKEQAEDYCLGEVPNPGEWGITLLGGADVQQNRIELCICAFGEDLECWLVGRKVFKFEQGKQHAFEESAWKELTDYVYQYNHPKLGEIATVCMDARYDPVKKIEGEYDVSDEQRKGIVETFCDHFFRKFIAIKGVADDDNPVIFRYKKSSKQSNTVNTEKIKHLIFSNLSKKSGGSVVHFPKYHLVDGIKTELSDFIFKSFCSEHFVEGEDGKMHWKRFFRQNEVLDCIVYAFGAAYYEKIERTTHEEWESLREIIRSK